MSDDAARPTSLTYRDAGVDIDTGNALIDRIKPFAAATRRPEVLAGLGGFGALFQVPLDRYKNPVLVAGTDGVGTKLKLALEMGKHDTIGIDLVAMCVNDLIVQGAESLFFLDYYATGKLDNDVASAVIQGIAEGCQQAGCSLIGGETAEMPGMYSAGDYDLAGFAVGIVERDAVIDGSKVAEGDVVLGLASSGPHSNGYSLIRRILAHSGRALNDAFDGRTLGDALLAPTRIYVKNLLALIAAQPIHALAHITGGGLLENIPRVLPEQLAVELNRSAWTWPPVFQWLQQAGNVVEEEMQRTFNCGIGMAIVVPAEAASAASAQLEAAGETVYRLGRVIPRAGDAAVQFVN